MASEKKASMAQVLRGFLPRQTFEHPNEAIVQVIGAPLSSAEVNKELLFEALQKRLDQWTIPDPQTGQPLNRAPGFLVPFADHADDYAAVEPEGTMFYKVWPLVLRCTRKTCEKAIFFDGENAWKAARNPAKCDLCGARRRQFDYMLVHECGKDRPLVIPPCPTHGHKHVYLHDLGSFETSTWYCRHGECGKTPRGKRIKGMAPVGCGCGMGTSFRHVTMRQDLRYISHTLKLINFEPAPMVELSRSPGSAKVVIGSYLEYFANDWQRALTDVSKDREDAEAKFAKVKRLMQLDESTPEEIADMRKTILGESGGAFDDIAELVGDDAVIAVGNAQTSRERTLIWGKAVGLSVWRMDTFQQAAQQSGRAGAVKVLQDSKAKLNDYGFSDLLVVDNFPVALAAFGYTRIGRRPENALLQSFPQSKMTTKFKGRTPIYCSTTRTEAVFFEMDAERVIAWLVANSELVAPPLPAPTLNDGLDRRRAAKAFMLRTMHADGNIRHRCLVLQHTLAHALIKNLGERSGFGEDTMSEYLMPDLLTVGLFADVHQELSLGALVALAEHRLGEWLDATSEGARSCHWDPHCGQHDGACMACLHLSFGCDLLNDELDRAMLFGAPEGHTPPVAVGYWDDIPPL